MCGSAQTLNGKGLLYMVAVDAQFCASRRQSFRPAETLIVLKEWVYSYAPRIPQFKSSRAHREMPH
jgi:hypothetical protein